MWQQQGDGRWTVPEWTDVHGRPSARQMLLAHEDYLVELHGPGPDDAGSTVHVYRQTAPVDPDAPLAAAEHIRTVAGAGIPAGDGEDVWAALGPFAGVG